MLRRNTGPLVEEHEGGGDHSGGEGTYGDWYCDEWWYTRTSTDVLYTLSYEYTSK